MEVMRIGDELELSMIRGGDWIVVKGETAIVNTENGIVEMKGALEVETMIMTIEEEMMRCLRPAVHRPSHPRRQITQDQCQGQEGARIVTIKRIDRSLLARKVATVLPWMHLLR